MRLHAGMCHTTSNLASLVAVLLCLASAMPLNASTSKTQSVLFPADLVQASRGNADKHPWSAQIRDDFVSRARTWTAIPDDDLWDMVFGPTIKRSWMVWSNGHCPSCRRSVPMYSWIADALNHPWKMRCPHCSEYFPKNDFHKYYRSGLDEHGVFDPARADRSLLFNADHPDPADPLHRFGVDDGEGYVDGANRWRFIGAYLIYGQWKQRIVEGIKCLSAAYLLTGDVRYAHKAGILLDRVADLYPDFDFSRQGVMYEGPPSTGYVSTWHDACIELFSLCIAYDQVFRGLKEDVSLPAFLSQKAAKYRLENRKVTFSDIQTNIEDRILSHSLAHRDRIHCNFPWTDITVATVKAVLAWPGNRGEIYDDLQPVIDRATAVDGVTGEKGVDGYSAMGPQILGGMLSIFGRADATFLADMFQRHPRLRETFRFHIDTFCIGRYYPHCGDAGSFGRPTDIVSLTAGGIPLAPSEFTWLWQLHEVTGDNAYAQVMFRKNSHCVSELPRDIFCPNPARVQSAVDAIVARAGAEIELPSVNKREWHLGILRSGMGDARRAVWMHYDSGSRRGHCNLDGMAIGFCAKRLDLLPDFGYPPVQYGGWGSSRSHWYFSTTSHNTVVVDDRNHVSADGTCTLWADGPWFRAIRAAAPGMIGGGRYERTAAMVDVSTTDSYVLDIFRVEGGTTHTKMLYAFYGDVETSGLSLEPAPAFPPAWVLRNCRSGEAPRPGWWADWRMQDRYQVLGESSKVHLRYADVTQGSEVTRAEAWISSGSFNRTEEEWLPCFAVRRAATTGTLASTFVAVIDAYEGRPNVVSVRRLEPTGADGRPLGDSHVALQLTLADGREDLLLATDVEDPRPVSLSESGIAFEGDLCLIRRNPDKRPTQITVCKGRRLVLPEKTFEWAQPEELRTITIP